MNILYAEAAAPVFARWITQAGITGNHNDTSYNPRHNRKGAEPKPCPLCALSGFRLVRADYVDLNA